jgi:hypothetical protein
VSILSAAKWSFVTRRVDQTVVSSVAPRRVLRAGDVVAARVLDVATHNHLEDRHGRAARLYPDDTVVGVCGNRYATDFYEGYVPTTQLTDLLTAGGLIGDVASGHTRRGAPTRLEMLGTLAGGNGDPLNLDQFQRALPASDIAPPAGTLAVLGASMNAGKTTTAAALVRGWTRTGIPAGAGKVTGSGSGKDVWSYVDAGARAVADFVDFGMPSTFGYPVARLSDTMRAIRGALVAEGAQAVVLEIADGILQVETEALLKDVAELVDGTVLAVSDALGAIAGLEILSRAGVRVVALSGRVTASPLAVREVQRVTDLPVLTPDELAHGAAASFLSRYGIPVDACGAVRL